MEIKSFRKYGKKPYKAILIHGGPGAAGSLESLAKQLASKLSVVEVLLKTNSLFDQVEEVHSAIKNCVESSVTVIGHSYGAMLSFIVAAKYPLLIKKIIMVGSGVFDDKYAKGIMETRLSRLTKQEQEEVKFLIAKLESHHANSDDFFHRLGKIFDKSDRFEPVEWPAYEVFPNQYRIYQQVWPQMASLRQSGKLLEMGKTIKCPVVVIHGDYDPHPFAAIKNPLSNVLRNVSFHLLENCGHEPWLERNAQAKFYSILYKGFRPTIRLETGSADI